MNTVAVFNDYGGVEELHYAHEPMPKPGWGEVLIQVVASGVNHMDAYVRDGRFQDSISLTFPAREGTDFSGIVRDKGLGVTKFKVGDEVIGHDPNHGAHAQFIVVPVDAILKKPERLSWEVAGSLYLAGVTALSIIHSVAISDGSTVIISAAAGGVGHIESQLARLAGATVIGIAGRENHDFLRSLGVKPLAYGDDLEDQLKEMIDGKEVSAFIDNYGDYQEMVKRLGIPEGKYFPSDFRREVEIRFYTAKGNDREALTLLGDIAELVETWNIHILISGFYAFENLPQALVDLDARHSRGKVVIGMNTAAPAESYLTGKLRSYVEKVEHVIAQPARVA